MASGASRGGQLFSIDFVASLVPFLIFFSIFFLVYSQLKAETAQAESFRQSQSTATLISDALVGTAGVPANWTNETVVTVGLASEEGVLSAPKVRALGNLSYSASKSRLASGGFEFFFNLTSLDGNGIFSYGLYPANNSTTILPVSRMVLYDQANSSPRQLSILRVIVWK